MKRVRAAGLLIVLFGSSLGALGCEREQERPRKRPFPPTAASGEELDGMQLAAGRRVALETAVMAMQHRDLQRLKQLRTWVHHRATVPLLEPADLTALDLAIECLEPSANTTELAARLEQMETGTLRSPAQIMCRGDVHF
jgi:hypothetical protein